MRQKIVWQVDEYGELCPFVLDTLTGKKQKSIWSPQPGSQEAFLACPVFEALYTSGRGTGKTDTLLMDFAQDVGTGLGREWRGILMRRSFPELKDVINKSQKWFKSIWGDKAKYNAAEHTWTWDTGESLLLRQFNKEDDYYKYHGSAFTWMGWEELTTWSSDEGYRKMMSLMRTSHKATQKRLRVRGTTNPSGPGHGWVKERYQLPVPHGRIIGNIVKTPGEPDRVAIHGHLDENKVLLHANPDYVEQLRASASSEYQLKAWLNGDWDIVAGGMFDEHWAPDIHIITGFPIKRAISLGWRFDRSLDWGQSKPFSLGWWAESNGLPVYLPNGRAIGQVPGDLVRIGEWYGWNGKPNQGCRMLSSEFAIRALAKEKAMGIEKVVKPGPADASIFDEYEPGKSTHATMSSYGMRFLPADKSAGSRSHGWMLIKERMDGASYNEEGYREEPGLFISNTCVDFIRTMPSLPCDDKNPDDVDTESEDHIADEARYRIRAKFRKSGQKGFNEQ